MQGLFAARLNHVQEAASRSEEQVVQFELANANCVAEMGVYQQRIRVLQQSAANTPQMADLRGQLAAAEHRLKQEAGCAQRESVTAQRLAAEHQQMSTAEQNALPRVACQCCNMSRQPQDYESR